MNTENWAASSLAKLTEELHPVYVGADLYFRTLNLFVRVLEPEMNCKEESCQASIVYAATEGRESEGIAVTVFGQGKDRESAAADAALQWRMGVLPVLEHWRAGTHSCFISINTLEITEQADGDRSAWQVIAGPVMNRGETDSGKPVDHDFDAYLKALSGVLVPNLLPGQPYWLECYAARFASGEIPATCRLNNLDWDAGAEVLKAVARRWNESTPSMSSRRQFMLLLPMASKSKPLPWLRRFRALGRKARSQGWRLTRSVERTDTALSRGPGSPRPQEETFGFLLGDNFPSRLLGKAFADRGPILLSHRLVV